MQIRPRRFKRPPLDPDEGERLDRTAYHADFAEWDAKCDGRDSYKLERRQHFEEADDPSWAALHNGNWEQALRLIERERPNWLAVSSQCDQRGSAFRRMRIVEEPLTPYMQWELHALRLQERCGIPVGVLQADELQEAEADGLLPELVILGGLVLFQVCYTEAGVPDGAVRYTDTKVIKGWQRFLQQLNEGAEPLRSYFARRVAGLPAPKGV